MTKKAGRKNAYDKKIKPRFDEIKEWVANGATERFIAKQLGVSHTTFEKYKNEKVEFLDIIKTHRRSCVKEIENSMYKSAVGGKETVKKFMKCKHVEYEDGKRVREYETLEPYEEEVYFPPNTTAGIYLLKHWAREKGYTNDPATLELKRQEFEYKKEIDEINNW